MPVISTLAIPYTWPELVSAMTGGEVKPEEVRPDWLEWAREEIDRYTGATWQSSNFVDELDGNGLDTVFTKSYPLIEIFDVRLEGQILITPYKPLISAGALPRNFF